MSQTITVSDTTFATLAEAAKARGVPLERLVEALANDVQMQPIGQPRTGETFLRFLGADDDEIAAPVADDTAEA